MIMAVVNCGTQPYLRLRAYGQTTSMEISTTNPTPTYVLRLKTTDSVLLPTFPIRARILPFSFRPSSKYFPDFLA